MVFQQEVCLDYLDLDSAIVASTTNLDVTQAIHSLKISSINWDHFATLLSFFRAEGGSKRALYQPENRKAYHCGFYHDGQKIDDGILIYFKSPNSHTGEHVLEFSFHGNPEIGSQILKTIESIPGFRLALPGEFNYRALVHAKVSLPEVLDVASKYEDRNVQDFINKTSLRFSKDIAELKNRIAIALSQTEAALDFEEYEFPSREIFIQLMEDVSLKLNDILTQSRRTRALLKSAKVVIIGSPNVGKSSLFNSIIGFDHAIVSDLAGTTRDIVQSIWSFKSNSFLLVDCAGIREAEDFIERIGIEKTLKEAKLADILIFCGDSPSDFLALPDDLRNRVDLKLLTKQDTDPDGLSNNFFHTSVLSRSSIERVKERVHQIFIKKRDCIEDVQVIARWQENFLRECLDLISPDIFTKLFSEEGNFDLIASHLTELEQRLSYLDLRINRDDLLNSIFSSLCIGK